MLCHPSYLVRVESKHANEMHNRRNQETWGVNLSDVKTHRTGLIALLTDFGTRDTYVAQMKGVILSIAPQCAIVDISHEVPPQDVQVAARMLEESARCFPRGTIHVVVVDPGVGTDRRILAVETGGQIFVAPDNGVLSRVVKSNGLGKAVCVEREEFWRKPVSATFHGRDILAPIAAHLIGDCQVDRLGSPVGEIVEISSSRPRISDGELVAHVEDIDRFGNVLLGCVAEDLGDFLHATTETDLHIQGEKRAIRCVETYADAEPGTLILLAGSQGCLELAITNGSAAQLLGVERGSQVAFGRQIQ